MLNKKAYLNPKLFSKNIEMEPTRNGYGRGLVEAGKRDKNVVVLCCDLKDSTRSKMFEDKFPDRFVEIGVAEQNMAGIAAGMSFAGKIPFISSYAVFSPGRNWDQIRVSICYSNANVKIAGAHSGISVGPDGATHQALEDIAITRVLPNMTVIAPCDSIETAKATVAAAKIKGPVYIRFAREKTPIITTPKTPFKIGKAEVYREGGNVSIIACGPLVYEALAAAEHLYKKYKIDCEVINSHTIKPLDEKTILRSAKKTGAVVTVEEHQMAGGLGGAIAEFLSREYPVYIERVGVEDTFGESGTPDELLKEYKLNRDAVVEKVKSIIKLK